MHANDTAPKDSKRIASLDLLRCILMFLIVLHHAGFHGCWKDDTTSYLIPYLFTTLLFWHVDGFIAISGWFGIRFTIARYLRLAGVMVFYSIIRTSYLCFFKNVPIYNAVEVSGGWYGNTYLAFMFIAPLLNVALERLATLSRNTAFMLWAVFDVGMILNWAPYNAFSGVKAIGGGSFSILTFVSVYVNVRLIRLLKIDEIFTKKTFVHALLIFLAGTMIFSVSWAMYQIYTKGFAHQFAWIGHTTYNSPHAILFSIAVLLSFVKYVYISGVVLNIVSWMTPLMFGVYMMHGETEIGRMLYIIPQRYLIAQTSLPPLIIIPISAIICFVLCIGIDCARRFAVKSLSHYFIRMATRLDESIGFVKRARM